MGIQSLRCLLIIVLAALLGACGNGADPSPIVPPLTLASTSKTMGKWEVIALNGNRLVGYKPTLDIGADGRIQGRSWCNSFTANARPRGGDRILLTSLSHTEAACYALSRESAFFALFSNVARFQLTRFDLTFFGQNGATLMTLVRADVDQMGGRTWLLREFAFDDIMRRIDDKTAPTLRFDGSAVTGHNGCSAFTANARRSGRTVAISNPQFATSTCTADRQQFGNQFMRRLVESRFVVLSEKGRMGLLAADGLPLMSFAEIEL